MLFGVGMGTTSQTIEPRRVCIIRKLLNLIQFVSLSSHLQEASSEANMDSRDCSDRTPTVGTASGDCAIVRRIRDRALSLPDQYRKTKQNGLCCLQKFTHSHCGRHVTLHLALPN
jgi:hypothetical protein